MPTKRIAVLGFMPNEELAKLVAGAGAPRLHPDLQEQIGHVQNSLIWVAARFDEATKQQIQKAQQDLGPMAGMLGPDLPSIIGIVGRGKGAIASLEFTNNKLKLSAGVTCNDANDATQLRNGVTNLWNTQVKQFMALAQMMGGAQGGPPIGNLLNEVTGSFTVELRGNTAIASVQVSNDTLQAIANAMPQGGMGGFPGMNPGGFPGMNPGGMPGGRPQLPPGPGKQKKIR
jgi:hypothetical protein